MTDIFQEVEEDVRRERYEKLWKKYGNYIIAAAAVLVLGVAGFQAWRTYELNQRQQISDRYLEARQAFEVGDIAKAEAEFGALAKEAPEGYATIAKFNLAGAYLAQGRRDEGVALLRELMASENPVIASTARLRLAWASADAAPKSEISALLQPLLAADNPWRFAAREVLAYVDLKDGAYLQAQSEYQRLAQEPEAPANLRQRAAGLSEFLRANPERATAAAAREPAAGAPADQGAQPK